MLIVIEGIDGSGKGTQAKLLVDKLTVDRGVDTYLLSYPQYADTGFGMILGRYLNGDFGPDVHPVLASLLYSLDRFEGRKELEAQLHVREIVVCDRYVISNIAYQCAKLDEKQADELQKWIEQLEYEVFELPIPDLVIYMDVSSVGAEKLIARKQERAYLDKGKTADIYEADLCYLRLVRSSYHRLEGKTPAGSWETVSVERNGHIRPVADIFADMWHAVSAFMGSE